MEIGLGEGCSMSVSFRFFYFIFLISFFSSFFSFSPSFGGDGVEFEIMICVRYMGYGL